MSKVVINGPDTITIWETAGHGNVPQEQCSCGQEDGWMFLDILW